MTRTEPTQKRSLSDRWGMYTVGSWLVAAWRGAAWWSFTLMALTSAFLLAGVVWELTRRRLGAFVLVTSVASLMLGITQAYAASFDCAKAQSRIEKAICADAEVSTLDEHLGRYYQAARAALQGSVQCLAGDQRQWLSVRNACADAACLKRVYLERLSELDALQPGASALKNVELPRVPTLVWIIPAARDKVAAPPKPNARPLEVRGELFDDLAQGDGFLLRGAQGSTLLAMLMFLEGDSAQQLAVLAKVPNSVYLARGYAATDPRGKIYYEPSRCVFLYRLP